MYSEEKTCTTKETVFTTKNITIAKESKEKFQKTSNE
jgi:hypothetical protein